MGIKQILGIKDKKAAAASKVACERRSAKRERGELKENMGMFGDMLKFMGVMEELQGKREERMMLKFQGIQTMQEEAAEEGAEAAMQQQAAAQPPQDAAAQLLEIAKAYLPAPDCMNEAPTGPRVIQSPALPQGAPGPTESEHQLKQVNKLLQGAGIDLSQIDPRKFKGKHVVTLKKLFSEVRR